LSDFRGVFKNLLSSLVDSGNTYVSMSDREGPRIGGALRLFRLRQCLFDDVHGVLVIFAGVVVDLDLAFCGVFGGTAAASSPSSSMPATPTPTRVFTFSESDSGSVVNDERVLNALTRPCVSLSAKPGGSGLAVLVLGVCGCGRRSGIRALRGSFLRKLASSGVGCHRTKHEPGRELTARGDRHRYRIRRVLA